MLLKNKPKPSTKQFFCIKIGQIDLEVLNRQSGYNKNKNIFRMGKKLKADSAVVGF